MTQLVLEVGDGLSRLEVDAVVKHLAGLRQLRARLRLSVNHAEGVQVFVDMLADLDQCIDRASRTLVAGRGLTGS